MIPNVSSYKDDKEGITSDPQTTDIMFIVDITASMSFMVSSLQKSLPQIFDLMQLTGIFDRLSILTYQDYEYPKLFEWSGWCNTQDADLIYTFASKLKINDGGSDFPEALKSAIWEALSKITKPTIGILYTDAAPHHKFEGLEMSRNANLELEALGEEKFNWLNICQKTKEQNFKIFSIVDCIQIIDFPFFTSLARITDGAFIEIQRESHLVETTIGVILNLCGVEFDYNKEIKSITMSSEIDELKYLIDNSDFFESGLEKSIPKILCVDSIKQKLGDPIQRFHENKEYQDLVFLVFERILTPENVISFTYNTIFGKLWRAICSKRKDPRRKELIDKLGRALLQVKPEEKELLSSFILETYDNMVEIEKIIQDAGEQDYFYVVDEHDETITRKNLFEIGLSCAPSIVRSVLTILQKIRISKIKPNEASGIPYLLVNLNIEDKFRVLPHLVCPGTMFSMRLSAIIAVISKISGSILQEEAATYLDKIRGKWLDFTLPENNSVDFARLLLRVSKFALTPEEVNYFNALIAVGSLKRSKERELEVEVAYSSNKSKREDYKERCKTCNQWRSLTLILDDTCAICISSPGEDNLEDDNKFSWMCECRNCLVHYAVYAVDDLLCKPKCHVCREGEIVPFVECIECKNKFLYQKSSPLNNYICPICDSNSGRVGQKHFITVQDYINRNNAGFIGMEIENKEAFFDNANKVSKTTPEERLLAVRNFAEITDDDFKDHKLAVGMSTKNVWNVQDLQRQVFDIFKKPNVYQCGICFDEFSERNLHQICGHKSKICSTNACKTCLKEWYNELKPGAVCQPAKLLCPYCKHTPLFRIVNIYNPLLSTVKTEIEVNSFDPSYIYAWCIKCYTIKKAIERICNQPNQIISEFNCENCINSKTNKVYKNCPGCNVLTDKKSGCNHITCMNRMENNEICNTHWCWVCNIKSTYDDIYKHMSKAHGGFFTEIEGDAYEDSDSQWSYDSEDAVSNISDY